MSFTSLQHAAKKAGWQKALSGAITDPQVLLNHLALDERYLEAAYRAAKLFPLKVTRSYLSRMEKGNPNDPLLRQVLPLDMECHEVVGYTKDPLHEIKANPLPGLLHKYKGRVLINPISACAIHCRYCFRRHFPYDENNPNRNDWQKVFDYIASDITIHEVILSGADPLTANEKTLYFFSDAFHQIAHIKRLRIHTRMPVVLPERITNEFIEWIAQLNMPLIIVIHANHPQEVDGQVYHALSDLKDAGVTLLNQSVILRGVNDDASILIKLSEVLFEAGVIPYYLHVLDKVAGAHHFDITLFEAHKIYRTMQYALPGYLVPKLVQEISGEGAKKIVA